MAEEKERSKQCSPAETPPLLAKQSSAKERGRRKSLQIEVLPQLIQQYKVSGRRHSLPQLIKHDGIAKERGRWNSLLTEALQYLTEQQETTQVKSKTWQPSTVNTLQLAAQGTEKLRRPSLPTNIPKLTESVKEGNRRHSLTTETLPQLTENGIVKERESQNSLLIETLYFTEQETNIKDKKPFQVNTLQLKGQGIEKGRRQSLPTDTLPKMKENGIVKEKERRKSLATYALPYLTEQKTMRVKDKWQQQQGTEKARRQSLPTDTLPYLNENGIVKERQNSLLIKALPYLTKQGKEREEDEKWQQMQGTSKSRRQSCPTNTLPKLMGSVKEGDRDRTWIGNRTIKDSDKTQIHLLFAAKKLFPKTK